jgi:hypothetical protein
VKIDAEGADLFVLQGMGEIVKKNKKLVLIVECNPKLLALAKVQPKDLFEYIWKLGFKTYAITKSGFVAQGRALLRR